MERLTTRCAGHAIMAYEHEEKYTTQEWIDMLTERLAAYEDTGLSPEDVNDLASVREISPEAEYAINKHADSLIERLDKLLHKDDSALEAYRATGLTPERVAELSQAEQDGRLVVLPCKAGDTVYVTFAEGYRPFVVDRIHILANCNVQVRMRHFCNETLWLSASEFGKTVFLTREEAEDALKGGAE